ncbi:MAG: hypothetical protein IT442_02190 [Phycisphaeraceae bacterium]|nr:hypothetical protein [Phycisphaeraceae bacterium]
MYESGQGVVGSNDVFIVPIGGGTPQLLSGTVTRNDVSGLSGVSPNGSFVLFRVSTNGDRNQSDLYSVPATGGQPVMLIAYGSEWSTRGYTPDGGNLLVTTQQHIYAMPLTGEAVTQLSSPSVSGYFAPPGPVFSPDGGRLLYWKGSSGGLYNELFSDRMDGGPAVQLNGGLGAVRSSVGFTPDGSQVAFATNQQVYITGIDGGTPRLLNTPASGFSSGIADMSMSPDGAYVVYKSDEQSEDFDQLYSVPVAGGDPVRLNNPISTTQDRVYFRSYASDSTQAVYEQRYYIGSVVTGDLYSVPLAGGSPINLTGHPTGIRIDETLISESDAGSRLVYSTSTAPPANNHLYSVNLDGSDRQALSAPVEAAGMDVNGTTLLSPDGRFAIFGIGFSNQYRATKLFAVPVGGGAPVAITPDLSLGTESIQSYTLTSDGSKIVYQMNQSGSVFDLFVAGFPLAAIGQGSHVAGGVAGGAGFAGGVDFDFSQVDASGTLRGEFFRTTAAELDGGLAAAIDFVLSGETIQVWDFGFDGSFTGLVTLTFTYDESLLGAGVAEDMLYIQHQLHDGSFEQLPVIGRDLVNNTITVQTEGFSAFVLGVVPEPSSLAVMCMLLGPWVLRWR